MQPTPPSPGLTSDPITRRRHVLRLFSMRRAPRQLCPRAPLFVLVAVGSFATGSASPTDPSPLGFDLEAPAAFESAVGDDTDAVLFPGPQRPQPRPTVLVATRVKADVNTVASVLLNPTSMREALPALVRADVVATRPGLRADAWPDRLIAWEVEIPLFNLTGKGWLQQRPGAVELTLVEGAFAPGHVRFRFARSARGNGGTSIVTAEIQVDASSSNWIFRRVARHDPWSETALSAATVWVLARAVALRAEAVPPQRPARPHDSIQPPLARALDGSPLAAPALAPLRAAGTLALVRRAPGGRLAWTSVAVPVPGSPAAVAARLGAPETWRVFPGWKSVTRLLPHAAPLTPTASMLIEVDDNVAFVDLDAKWTVTTELPSRATAVDGDIRGAVFGWDVAPGDQSGTSLAVLSMHPHLDAAGFIERRLVAAEPLLEHALAVALAYVDAAATADSLVRAATRP